MSKKQRIPVHGMSDWFSGVYIKPFGDALPEGVDYAHSAPHRHDFYYIVLVEQGELTMEVDLEVVHLGNNSLFLSYPGQIHRIVSADLKSGWFLAFDPALLDEALKSLLDQFLAETVSISLNPFLLDLVNQLYGVYTTDNLFREKTISALVSALIYQLAGAYLSGERSKLLGCSARSVEINKNFKLLLRRHYLDWRRPAEYAAAMNISATHLNDTVKSVTGFPVTYHIQQEVMREARRLLAYSDLSVKEIAATLNFEDAKYFSRLFRAVCGRSPGDLRIK